MLNPDFHDMLSAFTEEGVEYLLVGAYALATHGYVRATGDMDLWVRPEPGNARRVLQALRRFGAPTAGLSERDFEAPDVVLQVGVPPRRIDVLTGVDGVTFEEAWPERVEVEVAPGLRVPVIGRAELIRNKEATGRPRDRADVEALRGGEAPR
ncbi:MAG: hypothetical protein ACK41D_07390 [Rubricoccaceae bacterium]